LIAFSSRNWRDGIGCRGFWHESFDKSNYLYGLNIAKNSIIKNQKSVLVEGEIDTLTMHKAGFSFTVGVLGSSLSVYQISILRRYCKDLFLAFDSDKAGESLFEKIKKIRTDYSLDNFNINLIPVRFPQPKDLGFPDEKKIDADFFIKNVGKDKMIELFKKSREDFKESNNVK
jgi:DNA primase